MFFPLAFSLNFDSPVRTVPSSRTLARDSLEKFEKYGMAGVLEDKPEMAGTPGNPARRLRRRKKPKARISAISLIRAREEREGEWLVTGGLRHGDGKLFEPQDLNLEPGRRFLSMRPSSCRPSIFIYLLKECAGGVKV